jgi:apolipoprotein D and lipocalin family protein
MRNIIRISVHQLQAERPPRRNVQSRWWNLAGQRLFSSISWRIGTMNRALALGMLSSMALATAGCAGMSDTRGDIAPQPKKPIDAAQFYTGRWYEIARTPMHLTDGCVAGTTDYYKTADGQLMDRDACRDGTPEGKEKTFAGPVTILNPENTKVSVRYTVFGIFPVSKTYWMLDHGDDYRWFIVSDPSFKNVSLFTRAAQPSPDEVKALTARAQALGYDTSKLEYPTEFPKGEGMASPN